MENRERLMKILTEACPTVDFSTDKRLVTDKVVDSLDMVAMISDIEDEFGISVGMEEMVDENFDSVDAILALIEKLS